MGMEGQNLTEMAELARKYPVHVRFIEMMPIGLGKQFEFCSEAQILESLEKRYGKAEPYSKTLGNGPGHYYSFEGFQGKVGFISAMSHKFCESCNRVRLTSQGYLKTCLQYDIGIDLKKLLREGAEEEVLQNAIEKALKNKPLSHQFDSKVEDHAEENMMAQIGG
jgi:cyclic pyranopterin phosphate synthase